MDVENDPVFNPVENDPKIAVGGIAVENDPIDKIPHLKPGPKPTGLWARKWTSCQRCGRTDRRHWARGLCETCYCYLHKYRPWLIRKREEKKEADRKKAGENG